MTAFVALSRRDAVSIDDIFADVHGQGCDKDVLFTFKEGIVVVLRLPTQRAKRREPMSVLFTNRLILAVFLVVAQVVGWQADLLIQLPVLWRARAAGIWLF